MTEATVMSEPDASRPFHTTVLTGWPLTAE
jgi:hypothetical protein